MKEISFKSLFSQSVHFYGIAAVHRQWGGGNKNNYLARGRDENILSYTIRGGKNIYTAPNGSPTFCLKAPAVVLITQGAPYLSETVTSTAAEFGETVCIRFKMVSDAGEPLRLKEHWLCFTGDDGYLTDLFFEVLQNYLKTETNILKIKIALYQIFGILKKQLPENNAETQNELLRPAFLRLRQYPGENLPVSELARLCNLSESYFRSRFKQQAGCSVTDYRNRLRIEKAEQLLQSSLWTTDLIAETLGFFDTSHFYRVYKKITGKTPRGGSK